MLNNDQLSSMVWLGIGALIMVFAVPHGLGGVHSPGAGFMPFLIGLAICILAVIVFIQGTAARLRGSLWESIVKDVRWEKPLITLAALLVYVLLMNFLGFILATALLVGFLLKVIHPQKWPVVLSGAVLTSLASYILFQIWLKTQLPVGILRF